MEGNVEENICHVVVRIAPTITRHGHTLDLPSSLINNETTSATTVSGKSDSKDTGRRSGRAIDTKV